MKVNWKLVNIVLVFILIALVIVACTMPDGSVTPPAYLV